MGDLDSIEVEIFIVGVLQEFESEGPIDWINDEHSLHHIYTVLSELIKQKFQRYLLMKCKLIVSFSS
jgi:hypothetical protein